MYYLEDVYAKLCYVVIKFQFYLVVQIQEKMMMNIICVNDFDNLTPFIMCFSN